MTTVVLLSDDGRLFKVDRNMVPTEKAWGGTFELWGRQWDDRRERWSKEDNLYYCNAFTQRGAPK